MKKTLLIIPVFVAFFIVTAMGVLAQEDDQGQTQDPTLRILNQIKERSQNKVGIEDDDVETTEIEETDENEKPEKPLTAEERQQKIQELKTMAKEKKCEVLGDRIDAKIEKYSAGYTKYIQSFENLYDRVNSLLLSLDGKGYDTEAVQENNDKLMGYIDQIEQMHEDFVTKMDGSRESSCLDNAKQFQNIVKEAKQMLIETRAMAKEMHTFVREELRPSLQQLRLEIRANVEDQIKDESDNVEETDSLDDSQKVDDNPTVQGVEDYDSSRNFDF